MRPNEQQEDSSSNPYIQPAAEGKPKTPHDGKTRWRLAPTVFFVPFGALLLTAGMVLAIATMLRYLQLSSDPGIRQEIIGNFSEFVAILGTAASTAVVGYLWVQGGLWCWARKKRRATYAICFGGLLFALTIWIISRLFR